jgi:monovalent cation:H+ antiporter, CPA1 family
MADVVSVLVSIAGLLIVIAVGQPLAIRLRLPPSVLLAAVGVAIGGIPMLLQDIGMMGPSSGSLGLIAQDQTSPVTFIYVFLPVLMFEAGLATDVRRTIEDAAPILVLAIVVTIITTAIIGLALWPFAPVSLTVCLLLGAIVSTTDPAAVIAIFGDVGAPVRLVRLVEGESLLNDATAIALFAVLLSILLAGGEPDIGAGLVKFGSSFIGGGALGVLTGRVLVWLIERVMGDRLAEASLTLGSSYLVFIAAERLLHVSGVVAVLATGATISALGRSRIESANWDFLVELWQQIAFWARSLIFVLASILVPHLLVTVGLSDVLLLLVLIIAAFGARIFSLFVLMPPLEQFGLTKPINLSYKVAIFWGGLRGALTLVLALAITEDTAIGPDIRRFIAKLATGFVLYTLFIHGTTLRWLIGILALDRLSPRDQALRDHFVVLAYAEVTDAVRQIAQGPELTPAAVERVVAPYERRVNAGSDRSASETFLSERDRLAVTLVALANQERLLVLETLAGHSASPRVVQILLANADSLAEGARVDGRLGYRRAVDNSLIFALTFRTAYVLYRRLGIVRFLADQLADRMETLLITRVLLENLDRFNDERIEPIFGHRISQIAGEIIDQRRTRVSDALGALRLQYPNYATDLEALLLRRAALRRETARYASLLAEGLIAREVYDDLRRSVLSTQAPERRPRLDIGLVTFALLRKLDILSDLSDRQLDAVARLLRPFFAVPNQRIVRKGDVGAAVYFIGSGAVEVILPQGRVRLGTGEFFGEMALLSGQRRNADIVALTYCRLLVLRKSDFERFMAANPDAKVAIERVAAARSAANEDNELAAKIDATRSRSSP